MILRELNENDKKEIIEMYNEYLHSVPIEGIDLFEGIRSIEKLNKNSFEELLKLLEKNKNEENLPKDYSPALFLIAEDNNKIIGGIDLRWKYVPFLETFGGLVGYSVRPSERGKGYATEMLKQGLRLFNDKDIDKILITCKNFNIASKKTIEKNGGIFENELFNESDGYTYLRYFIENK